MTIKRPPNVFRFRVLTVSLPTHAPAGALAHRPTTARRKAVWPLGVGFRASRASIYTGSARIRLERAPHPASGVNAIYY